MTSCNAAAEAPRSLLIDGSATLTMKKSSGGRKAPTSRIASAVQRRGSGQASAADSASVGAHELLLFGTEWFLFRQTKRSGAAVDRQHGVGDDVAQFVFVRAGLGDEAHALNDGLQIAAERLRIAVRGR